MSSQQPDLTRHSYIVNPIYRRHHMMQVMLGDLVNTAGDLNVTAVVESVLEDTVLDRKIKEKLLEDIARREALDRKAWSQQVWPIFEARQAKYRKAIDGEFGNVAWLIEADGSLDDVRKAAKLFNGKAAWSECVNDIDYERIGAVVDAHNVS